MSDFLGEMAAASLAQVRKLKERPGLDDLEARAASASPPHPLDVSGPGFDIIAEAKLASPAQGRLVDAATADRVLTLARDFRDRGAAVISILTEETRFAGSLQHLEQAAAEVEIPVLRKDFLVDPIQIFEARTAGASGVLLIARLLPEPLLSTMTDLALSLEMFVIVEVFDRSDLETAVPVFDRDVLVGVNSRDLASLEVDPTRFASLAPHLPDHIPAVAESGMTTPDDVAAVADLGYRLALVGSSLVTAVDPGGLLEQMIRAGRGRTESAG